MLQFLRQLPIVFSSISFRWSIPVLSFGDETWTTTKRLEKKKLRVTERAMQRIMIEVIKKDRVINEVRGRNQCRILLRPLNQRSGDGQVTCQGGMATGGHAKQPIGLQKTNQEKEGDKRKMER